MDLAKELHKDIIRIFKKHRIITWGRGEAPRNAHLVDKSL